MKNVLVDGFGVYIEFCAPFIKKDSSLIQVSRWTATRKNTEFPMKMSVQKSAKMVVKILNNRIIWIHMTAS